MKWGDDAKEQSASWEADTPPPSSASISAQEVVAPLTALSMEITPICLEWLRTAPALPLSSGFSVGKLKITASRG